jgi:hypothetical protein
MPSSRGLSIAVALCAGLLFCVIFAIDIGYPGLFMDSINPEYLAPRILDHERAGGMFAYTMPGNLIADRFPVLAGSFYHGPLQLYLSLPVYALLGTDIVGARVAQGMYGLAIVLLCAALLRQQRTRPAILVIGLAFLVTDPAFVQSFKTQALSTVWPLSLILLGTWLIERRAIAGRPPGRLIPILGGALAGLSFFAYFIHLFFLPAQLMHLTLAARAGGVRGRAALAAPALFLAGFVIGCLPYFLGYGLIVDALGWRDFLSYAGMNGSTLVGSGGAGTVSPARLSSAYAFVHGAIDDAWLSMTVFSMAGASFLGAMKLVLLSTLVALGLYRCRGEFERHRLLSFASAAILSFVVISLPIVHRLHGHHFVVLLPLLYLAVTQSLALIAGDMRLRRPKAFAIVALPLLLLADNLHAHRVFLGRLEATQGAGDYSATINRLATDAMTKHKNDLYLFPDWGFFMPFAFMTGGRVDYVADPALVEPSGEALRDRVLTGICRGRSVELVRAGMGVPDPHLDPLLAKKNGWVGADARRSLLQRRGHAQGLIEGLAPTTTTYSQPDGTPVFDVYRFEALADTDAPLCEGRAVPMCKLSLPVPGSKLSALPCLIDRCPAGGLPTVDVSWKAATGASVEIWVGTKDGEKKLWAGGAAEGKQTTGPWINSGTEFEMREAGTGKVLAVLRLGGPGCGP